jgi:predicted HTH domain antitoxin
MVITVDLPDEEEELFRVALGPDLGLAAREAMLIEAYRRSRISLGRLGELLGLETTHEADEWLARRGVPNNYTNAHLQADSKVLQNWREAGGR